MRMLKPRDQSGLLLEAFERLGIGSERELLKWYLAMWGSFQRD